MGRTMKAFDSRSVVMRVAVLSAGLALGLALGVERAQAQAPFTSTLLARGPFGDRIDFKVQVHGEHGVDVAQVHEAADMVVAQITVQPGASIGWHSHPGPAVVVVIAGTLTIYDGDDPTCTGRAYTGEPSGAGLPPVGQAFVDIGQGHVHDARNHEAVPATVIVTYFDVPAGTSPLILAGEEYTSACPTD